MDKPGSTPNPRFMMIAEELTANEAVPQTNQSSDWLKCMSTREFVDLEFGGFTGWERRESSCYPAFVKLAHLRGEGPAESRAIASKWDDVAETAFYYCDWSDGGFVRKGDMYWSGWWFMTVAERDRFLNWFRLCDVLTGLAYLSKATSIVEIK